MHPLKDLETDTSAQIPRIIYIYIRSNIVPHTSTHSSRMLHPLIYLDSYIHSNILNHIHPRIHLASYIHSNISNHSSSQISRITYVKPRTITGVLHDLNTTNSIINITNIISSLEYHELYHPNVTNLHMWRDVCVDMYITHHIYPHKYLAQHIHAYV